MVLARIKIDRAAGGTEYINGIAAPSITSQQTFSVIPETQIQLFAGDVIALQIAAAAGGQMGLTISGQTQNKYASLSLSVLG